MLEDLQLRHYSPTTIRLYLYAIREFAKHFGKPPDQLGAEHIRRYQLFLTKEKKVSTSTYVLMVCALRFFYTHTLHRKVAIERIPFPRRERKLPLILSREVRFRRSHAISVLPEPPNRSATRSPALLLFISARSISSTGFAVGWIRFAAGFFSVAA
jgi:site-specific recombinase XerD